jgi:hypothetical protein
MLQIGIFLAIVAAWSVGIWNKAQDRQRAADNEEIVAAETKAAKLQLANETLQAQYEAVSKDAMACGAAVGTLGDLGTKLPEAIRREFANGRKADAALHARGAQAAAAAKVAATGTPAEQCAKVDARLDELADVQRGINAAPPAAPISAQPVPKPVAAPAPRPAGFPLPPTVKGVPK